MGNDGTVSVVGPGEAAITLVFATAVTTMRVTIPYPNTIAREHFNKKPVSRIDELVLKKLASLQLPPSPACDDYQFIRRAYLDTCGLLPEPEEVHRFVRDTNPGKRSALILALLEKPAFVDYWSYKWSDLLLVSTRKLPQPAMWSFYRSIRQAVADNKPWDELARDLIGASGSTLRNGFGNFYVLHKDPADLTEAIAATFLGMSITCARCHNHPLEKWTQDQYWSLANMFARVSLKNGDRTGDIIVFEKTSGDVLHPRRGLPMPPAALDAPASTLEDTRNRRELFVDWLTAADNPFFAKAVTNRVWKNFLGRGLVESEDDLRATNPASNEELFEFLAEDFRTHHYDIKYLIRTIMNSEVYQRSARPISENATDNVFYSHGLIKRLPAEIILDCQSQVTQVPTVFDRVYTGVEGGSATTGNYPLGTRALQLPDSRVASRFLDLFGRPDRMAVCSCERQQDATVGQALMLNNGEGLNKKLRSPDSRIRFWLETKKSHEYIIHDLFLRALSRPPTDKEYGTLLADLSPALEATPAQRHEYYEDLVWGILTSREFLFNH